LVRPTPLALSAPLFRILRWLTCAALLPAWLEAQATPTVPPDHPVYAFIDRLVAARLVDTVIVGQRSMSRREVGRIIAEARGRAVEGSWLADGLREYSAAFPVGTTAPRWVTLIEADATALESPPRGIATDANGAIDVALNPLTSNQLGRQIADGASFSYRGAVAATLTPWLSFGVAERSTYLAPRGNDARTVSEIDQAYARGLWKNLAITVGRDPLFLGQASQSSLAISLNARPFNQVRLASDKPFLFPSLLRYLGPAHATVALGDLGRDQFFPHSRLFAYKLSIKPHARFEIATGFSEQVGGEGSPGGTFIQKAGDAFPLLDALLLHRNFLFSNKFVLVDLRYTIPGVRGAQFYVEGTFDDFDLRRTRSVFTQDAGWVWGLSASCFAECGPVRVAAEYHVTGVRFYTHGAFQSGYTVGRDIIGDQLGPRGRGAYAMLDVDGQRGSVSAAFAYEDRSGDKWGSISTTPDDSDFRLAINEHHPAERRWRPQLTLTSGRAFDRTRYSVMVGAERVDNFRHVHGAWRTNWLSRIGVEYRPTLPFF
jgi:hypothetical protein